MTKNSFAKKIISGSMILLLLLSGCRSKTPPAKRPVGSPVTLTNESLQVMKNVNSYRFTGSGAIHYIGVNHRGTFRLAGEYLSPQRSHLKMEMKLGNANYYSEVLYRAPNFYQFVHESWKMVTYSPDTLMQPGYQPVNTIIDQIAQVSTNPVFGEEVVLGGSKVTVVKLSSNPTKLKSYLQKQFNKAAAIEPERRQGLTTFLRTCNVSQGYTLYIDPATKRIVKLLFLQTVKINLSNKTMENQMSIEYSLSDFGTGVKLPTITGKH